MSTTCPTCGAEVTEGRTTCQVCGADVPSGATSGSTPPPPSAPGTPGPPSAGPGAAPAHPSALTSEVRNWGMAAHLSAFLGAWVALAFVGPLVIWLIKREEHPFIEHHAKEALNFNISVLIYGAISAVLIIVGIGILMLLAVGISWIVLTILAAVKAANGEGYRYPMTIRFVS